MLLISCILSSHDVRIVFISKSRIRKRGFPSTLLVNAAMYVCMYVCMYVYIYIYVFVCDFYLLHFSPLTLHYSRYAHNENVDVHQYRPKNF